VIPCEVVTAFADRYGDARAWVADHALHSNGLRSDRQDYVPLVTGFLADAFGAADGRREADGG
jgi:hypothetical protein